MLLQTAVVFKPVSALTDIVFVKQVRFAVKGVTVYVGAFANDKIETAVLF